jgi:hypothetical protein
MSNNEAIVLASDPIILYVTSYFECYNCTSSVAIVIFKYAEPERYVNGFHAVFFLSRSTFTFFSLTKSSRSLSSRVALMNDIALSY